MEPIFKALLKTCFFSSEYFYINRIEWYQYLYISKSEKRKKNGLNNESESLI